MTGISNFPRLASFCSAGKIFLCARSPVAPKNTSASDVTCIPCSLPANDEESMAASTPNERRLVRMRVISTPRLTLSNN